MWASAAHYKEIPSGAGELVVWDRCNYSDNIREPALPAVLSPRLGECEAGAGECSYLALSFTFSTFFFPLLFFSPLMRTRSYIFFFSLPQERMFIYSPPI